MKPAADNTALPAKTADGGTAWPIAQRHNGQTHASAVPPAAHGGPVDSAVLGRTAIGLLVVIGIILLCAWLLKRLGPNRIGDSQKLRLVAARSVGNRERVVVVEIEDRWLVLGVTPHSVNHLHTLDAQPPDPESARRQTPTFSRALADNLAQIRPRRPRP